MRFDCFELVFGSLHVRVTAMPKDEFLVLSSSRKRVRLIVGFLAWQVQQVCGGLGVRLGRCFSVYLLKFCMCKFGVRFSPGVCSALVDRMGFSRVSPIPTPPSCL